MQKKLSKYGNSLAVLIDKPILELLNIDESTPLKIKTDGRSIIIEPLNPVDENISSDKKVQKTYEELLKQYGEAFKKLADK